MIVKEKINNEIARLNDLIKESEIILEQVPEHLKENQRFALEICKKQLGALEQELKKLEDTQ